MNFFEIKGYHERRLRLDWRFMFRNFFRPKLTSSEAGTIVRATDNLSRSDFFKPST